MSEAKRIDPPVARRRLAEIAQRFGLDPGEVTGKSRAGSRPAARHWWWWVLVKVDGYSRVSVSIYAQRDTSTVWYAVDKCDSMIRRGLVPAEMEGLV